MNISVVFVPGERDCGTYLTGDLATMATDQMPNLLDRLLELVDVTRRSRCRLCSLSDFVRLPVVEACAWMSSPDKVIQMVHTKDDLYTLEGSGQVLINPYTRICLVGSASLASFVEKDILSLRALQQGCNVGRVCPTYFLRNSEIDKIGTVNLAQTGYSGVIGLRVVEDPDLRYCEMARWKVTMVAEDRSEFELASVSLLGDWVSRRGDIKSSSDGAFPSMVFGEMVNLENLIAAVQKEGALQPAASNVKLKDNFPLDPVNWVRILLSSQSAAIYTLAETEVF
nr:seryl tRNA synthetase mitochondrial [Hymenolepis microstoma]